MSENNSAGNGIGAPRRGRAYANRYPHAHHGLADIWRMLREYRRSVAPPVRFEAVPERKQAQAQAQTQTQVRADDSRADALTWIGHDSFLIRWQGVNLLTDPVFSERASPFAFAGPRRVVAPALGRESLPPIELVLVSHNHYDHLDAASVRRLAREHPDASFVVPRGLKRWFLRRGITQAVELDWWQQVELAGCCVTAVPAQHFSGRGVFDRNRVLWCGFVVERGDRRLYFAGDTGYSRDFADIGERFAPIDVALLPIGAYAPRWFMEPMHVNPEDAVKIHQDVGARLSVAMHWGTFRLTTEPLDEPPRRLAAARAAAGLAASAFRVLRHGECLRLG